MTSPFSLPEVYVRGIADAVAQGDLTPTDVFESVLERIEATEDKIHAWSQLDVVAARAQAETLTAEARAGKLRGPLHGVPVAIKEQFYVQGMPMLCRGTDAWIEPEDSTVVARLRAAGAIIVGKTNMPIDGKNPPTRNPWNLMCTAGGSSSGSGAAVGARVVPLAIGEETGGSNLRPAAYCGVEAIRPTYGRISRFGCYPFTWSRDHPALIGLTMADMALVLSVVAGYDPKDPTTMSDPPTPADLKMSVYAPPHIGIVRNFFPERTEPVMQEAIDRSATRLSAAGAILTAVKLPAEYGLAWAAGSLVTAENAAFTAGRRAAQPATSGTAVGGNDWKHRATELIPATYYLQSRRARTWLIGKVQELFKAMELDALLMAVAPGPAPMGLESTGDDSLLSPWSFLGFPAITVNGGLSPDGLPLGLQFVGAPRTEYELMRVGAWCSATLGRLSAPVFV
jgi:aspartyl-tRNA(Asn)/glutamyl-tRNA(Gln) amidotransferase subunit A